MKDNMSFWIFVSVMLICSGVFAALPDGVAIMVNRNLSGFVDGDEVFEVLLEVEIRNNVTVFAVEEIVPSGASVGNCSGGYCSVIDNKLEILVFNNSVALSSKKVSYDVILNSDAGDFVGSWKSVDPDLSGNVIGNDGIFNGISVDDISNSGGVSFGDVGDEVEYNSVEYNSDLDNEKSKGGKFVGDIAGITGNFILDNEGNLNWFRIVFLIVALCGLGYWGFRWIQKKRESDEVKLIK